MKSLYTVPFHGQSWNLEAWKELGFASREEAAYWQDSSCGVLCLKMAIEFFTHQRPSIRELIVQGQKLDAYTHKFGWGHDGLIRLVRTYGLEGKRVTATPEELAAALRVGQLPVVSIKWAFQTTKTIKERLLFWKKYGGHLALVVGIEEEDGELAGLYVHHTSTKPENNWQGRLIPLKVFQDGYTGRAIILSKQGNRR